MELAELQALFVVHGSSGNGAFPYAPYGAFDIDCINLFCIPHTSQNQHIEGLWAVDHPPGGSHICNRFVAIAAKLERWDRKERLGSLSAA